jgi:hypothetical protein
MPLDKRGLQERLHSLVEQALEEALTQNGGSKEAVKVAVKQSLLRRVSQIAEQEATAIIDEALGVKEAGFRT